MSRDRWVDALLAALIVAAAAALRLWQLDSVPLGLHNDEAWTGLNAREVLRDGWIGPYVYPSGLGQPAGPVYVTALLFTVLPQTTFTLRLSMALFGIAAVGFTYVATRVMFDRTTALLAAALLAIMPWHLHLSRTAFMVNAWLCMEMATLWVLFRARARPNVFGFAGVGVLVGLGIYTYNAYALFVPVVATPFLYDLVAAGDASTRRRRALHAVIAAVTALWASGLMIDYAVRHEEYFWHHESVSVFHDGTWRDASWSRRAGILASRGGEWAKGVFVGGRRDDGDGLGGRGHPLLDPLIGVATVVGLVLAARGWRRPACGVLLVAAAIMPLGALLTTGDGLYRRTFGLAPFVAVLASLPIAWVWRRAQAWPTPSRRVLAGALSLAIGAAGVRNAHAYFGPLQRGQQINYVFPYQIDAAARAVARLPGNPAVYLYSDRWGAGFETVKWLAPQTKIVDRSHEFRRKAKPDDELDLAADAARPTVFVVLGRYLYLAEELRRRYPDAVVTDERRDAEVLYKIVLVGG